ncbi:MAG: Sugar kinase, ribokinase family [Candidatus Bathyarchaeota archaeon B63]|nr:MAG: Sugar kinase, ribokinase family [Candidatus Bathyarchaeota archaeon B63]
MRFDVICFGALNVDKLYKVDRIASAEEESRILEFKESPGGSAANTAVGLARLGVRTGFIGKVATDREGDLLIRAFLDEGVNTDGIVISEYGRSGTVIGFVDEEGERALYVDPGVNDSLKFDEIDLEYASQADMIHLTSFVGDVSFQSQKRLVEALPGTSVSMDPGAIYARRGLEELKPIIGRCLVFFPNEHELRLLTGKDYREGAEDLLRMGARIIAVKLGARGCYVTDGEESHMIGPFDVEVIDSTGAGDAFCAGFIYGLIKNKTLRECGVLGNFVASRALTRMGARNGLPRRDELPL